MIKYPPIDPKEVYDSLYTRSRNNVDWYEFLGNSNIEVISYLDPCTMESKGNKFVVCDDPAGDAILPSAVTMPLALSLKIPEQLAHEIRGNPYFDVEATDADYPRIESALNNLSEQDKEIVEKAKEFGDGSGNRNMEVSLTVNLNCNWDGDLFYPRVTVDEISGVNWDKVKHKAKNEVLNKVSEYKRIVIKIATELKISSNDVHQYIMWD